MKHRKDVPREGLTLLYRLLQIELGSVILLTGGAMILTCLIPFFPIFFLRDAVLLTKGVYIAFSVAISAACGSALLRRLLIKKHPEVRPIYSVVMGPPPPPFRWWERGVGFLVLAALTAFLTMIFCGASDTVNVLLAGLFAIIPEANRRALGITDSVPMSIWFLWVTIPIAALVYKVWRAWKPEGVVVSALHSLGIPLLYFGVPILWIIAVWRIRQAYHSRTQLSR